MNQYFTRKHKQLFFWVCIHPHLHPQLHFLPLLLASSVSCIRWSLDGGRWEDGRMDRFNLLMISLSALSTVRGAAPLCCRGQQYIGKNYEKPIYQYFLNKSILFDKYMESQKDFNISYFKICVGFMTLSFLLTIRFCLLNFFICIVFFWHNLAPICFVASFFAIFKKKEELLKADILLFS